MLALVPNERRVPALGRKHVKPIDIRAPRLALIAITATDRQVVLRVCAAKFQRLHVIGDRIVFRDRRQAIRACLALAHQFPKVNRSIVARNQRLFAPRLPIDFAEPKLDVELVLNPVLRVCRQMRIKPRLTDRLEVPCAPAAR